MVEGSTNWMPDTVICTCERSKQCRNRGEGQFIWRIEVFWFCFKAADPLSIRGELNFYMCSTLPHDQLELRSLARRTHFLELRENYLHHLIHMGVIRYTMVLVPRSDHESPRANLEQKCPEETS